MNGKEMRRDGPTARWPAMKLSHHRTGSGMHAVAVAIVVVAVEVIALVVAATYIRW